MRQRNGSRRRRYGQIYGRWVLLAFLLTGGIAACGADRDRPAADPVGYRLWDSAGIRIGESPSDVLETTLPWLIDTVPNLEVGQADGLGPSQFHRIEGIVGLRDGGLVVLDGGSEELRWFDDAGEHVVSLGREGEGPGEFLRATLVPQFRGDSLLVFDRRSRRFTWVAKDGSGYRLQEPPEGGNQLITGAASAAKGSRVLFRTGSAECIEADYCESSVYVRWVDPTEGLSDTIAEFSRKRARIPNSAGLPFGVGGPFDQMAAVAIGPRGPVVEGGRSYELKEFDEEGRLMAKFRVDAPLRDTTEEALDYLVQRQVERELDENLIKRAFARMGIPDALPAFQAIIVDRVGWYWAELYRLDQADPSFWLVFDGEGQARGLIEMPEDLEVREIGEDYILGRWSDELGVQYVRRYGLNRIGD